MTTRKNGSGTLLFRQGYDLKNRLVEADADGDADADLRLAYDHQEGRVARHTLDGTGAVTASEHYLLDRMNPTGYEQVLEQAAGLDDLPTRSFVLGLSLILQADGSVLQSMLFDGHGTGRGLVDATGRIASSQILAYDAFGVRTDAHSAVLTPIQYTGQWFDEVLGQGYHRHRWLTHATGRFNTLDSFEGSAHSPLTLHKFVYGSANPLLYTDPSGLVSLAEQLVVTGVRAGLVALNLHGIYTSGIAAGEHGALAWQAFGQGKIVAGITHLALAIFHGGLAVASAFGVGSFFRHMPRLSGGLSLGVTNSGGALAIQATWTNILISNPALSTWVVREALPALLVVASTQLGLFSDLPERVGDEGKTSGLLDTGDDLVGLNSGNKGPAEGIPQGTPGFDGVFRQHVEGHAVAKMIQDRVQFAFLRINNDPCQTCMRLIEKALPEGAVLWVKNVINGNSWLFRGGS